MTDRPCPRCGNPVPVDSGASGPTQCPRCLLRPPWDRPAPIAITLGPGQSFVPPSIEELSEHIVGYDVNAKIGQGGMGAVYSGRQKSLDRPVAIKILPPQIASRPGFRERFAREGRALAKLNHPNIVAVYDFGQAGPYAMLVMELVEGANLREVLAQGRLSQAEALEIIPQLCDALSYAHEEGVVHRDIKPENLLFDARGRLKITDFGLAKLLATKSDSSETESDSREADADAEPADQDSPTRGVVGTIHYMAPEQLEKPRSVDHRADLYALGVVFYEMLTGELPIGRFEPPSSRVNLPPAGSSGPPGISIDIRLDEVVLKALEKQPEKRYANAAEILSDLHSIERQPDAATDSHPDESGDLRQNARRYAATASNFASTAYRRGRESATDLQHSLLKHPSVDGPAVVSAVLLIGGCGLAMFLSSEPRGEFAALLTFVVACVAALILARLALSREERQRTDEGNLLIRFVLGAEYLMVAGVAVVAPVIVAIVTWIAIQGDVREPGQSGWFRDWVHVVSVATIISAAFWLTVLVLHVLFPAALRYLFKPFVGRISVRAAALSTLLLVLLITGAAGTLISMPYRPYVEGEPVPPELIDQLSPRDAAVARNVERQKRTYQDLMEQADLERRRIPEPSGLGGRRSEKVIVPEESREVRKR
ncbi:serine/threonine protein kinase [Roseiconus nitratireducens]|uniref:Serine/threonine protein kinase n=1 Tax=Roseiconus nitratireducens TaxID=2605748 RepID=A0A5M6DD32_9BACT|nr:serine/threonine-protein kinase [Roseiconus nitratireducens]KAA5545313.1 serine/threonine protein kinase [Roseiconus nitratireducens]